MVDVVKEINWGTRLRRTDFYNMLYYDADELMQVGIGKSNWPTPLKRAYDDVQNAMDEIVEQRDQMMNRGMPGRGGEFREEMIGF